MFSTVAAKLFLASTVIASVLANPIPTNHEVTVAPVPVDIPVKHDIPPIKLDHVPPVHAGINIVPPHKGISFNNWGGFASLNKFDDFYGIGNFDGSLDFHKKQVVVKDKQLVCRTQEITVIQQRLLILQEMAKKIILEQVCEVETQTIVFQQFHAGLGRFNHDLLRLSDNHIGFDQGVVKHFGNIVNFDGTLSTHDFGFKGLDLGSQTVVVGGHNWDDARSPASVFSAFGTSRAASSFL